MWSRWRALVALAAIGSLSAPSSALAVTAVSPADGARVTPTPTLVWRLDSGETSVSAAVYRATSSGAPIGSPAWSRSLSPDQTSVVVTPALAAGTYVWRVHARAFLIVDTTTTDRTFRIDPPPQPEPTPTPTPEPTPAPTPTAQPPPPQPTPTPTATPSPSPSSTPQPTPTSTPASGPSPGGAAPPATPSPSTRARARSKRKPARPKPRTRSRLDARAELAPVAGNPLSSISGRLRPARGGEAIAIEAAVGRGWRRLVVTRTLGSGTYSALVGAKVARGSRVRARFAGNRGTLPAVARASTSAVYAPAEAAGPGPAGAATACGRARSGRGLGVAHRTLACGTRVTLLVNNRSVHATVVGRAPATAPSAWYLSEAVAARLAFSGSGTIWAAVWRPR